MKLLKTFLNRNTKTRIDLGDMIQNGETMTRIEYLLDNFGSSIVSINLGNGFGDGVKIGDIVGLIDQHCKNIKQLSLHGRTIENVRSDNYSELFGRLEALNIVGGFLGVNQFLAACSQLKVLEAMMVDCLDLTHVSLPRLVELTLRFFNCRGMGEFLIRHPHIEALTIGWSDAMVTDSLSNDTDQFIFDHLPNIRYMEMFEISDDKISRLSAR